MSTCKIPGCERKVFGHGWCNQHYSRWRRRGDPLAAPTKPLAVRFWEKIDKNGPIPEHAPELGKCWIWKGSVNRHGYGQIRAGGVHEKNLATHRASWELHNGPIPDGKQVLHHCDNRPCPNPHHLFLGNAQDNIDDMYRKGRAINVVGEANGSSKLTTEDVHLIRVLFNQKTIGEIAALFNVSRGHISDIRHRRRWGKVA